MATAGRALVTGGSSGLGKALCQRLHTGGWHVVNCDIARPGDGHGAWIRLDLSDRDALDRAIPEILTHGPYDLVVHNAGASATGRFEALPVKAMLRLVRLNAEAPMVLTSALEAGGLARGARLVFVSSLAHFTGYPGAAAYAATKDALAAYARGAAEHLRAGGIHVLTVFPGPIATPHAERHAPAGADADRRVPPEQLADLVLAAARKGKATLVPGRPARLAAIAGRLAPGPTTRFMRRRLFDRLGREVW